MHTIRSQRLALGLSLALATGGALAQAYDVTLLPGGGGRHYAAVDINNLGQVVGEVGDTHFPQAVLWDTRTGGYTSYLPFYAECCTYMSSWASAINDRGQVVGSDTDRAALWNPGAARPVLLSGEFAWHSAQDINNSGTAVGYTGARAVMWDSSGAHVLGTLGGAQSAAYAINEAGVIAGTSQVAGSDTSLHAALWRDGGVVDLGPGLALGLNDLGVAVGTRDQRAVRWDGAQATFLGGVGSQAFDVNDAGWAVGGYYDVVYGEPTRAMLWRDGQAIDLTSFLSQAERDAGWILVSANAINELGWIAGAAFNTRGVYGTAFVMSIPAIPEPASLVMLMAGLGVIGAAARRTRRSPTCA